MAFEEEYYEKMTKLWQENYPSVSNVKEIEQFYEECGLEMPIGQLIERFVKHPKVFYRQNRMLDFGCDNGIMLNWFKGFVEWISMKMQSTKAISSSLNSF